jgi:alpha-L-glutamate ligase-like protein
MIGRLGRIRREFLGINRRNHDYLFRWNRRDRWRLVDDKIACKVALETHGVPVPPVLDRCDAQWEIAALGGRLAAHRDFVLKPARGTGGGGIMIVVDRDGDAFVKASGVRLGWPYVAAHVADILAGVFSLSTREDSLLVEGRVVPEPVTAALAFGGVADLRVLLLRGVPVLAMLRLPTRRSDGRANLHVGGVGVGVSLDEGRTTFGISGRAAIDVHPDLEVPLGGVALPCWDEALRLATRAADAVGLGFIGVDIVFDERRGPLVLELNARPGLAIQLANRRGLRPLLERVESATVPADVDGRIALGRRLYRDAVAPGAKL